MPNFEKNTQEALDIFKQILPSYELRKDFFSHIDDKISSYENLLPDLKKKMDEAIELLVDNARDAETRKKQQQNFGPTLAILKQSAEIIVEKIQKDEIFFIELIQLSVIFLHVHEIENKNHSHDNIRLTLKNKIAEIIPLLK